MKAARAAELWARLEKKLIERCGLPNGHMLDVERPGLVRTIGSMLSGRAAAGDTLSPPLPAVGTLRLDDSAPVLTFKSTRQSPTRTIHDPKLAAYLDRACSLRGYDPDDSVPY